MVCTLQPQVSDRWDPSKDNLSSAAKATINCPREAKSNYIKKSCWTELRLFIRGAAIFISLLQAPAIYVDNLVYIIIRFINCHQKTILLNALQCSSLIATVWRLLLKLAWERKGELNITLLSCRLWTSIHLDFAWIKNRGMIVMTRRVITSIIDIMRFISAPSNLLSNKLALI